MTENKLEKLPKNGNYNVGQFVKFCYNVNPPIMSIKANFVCVVESHSPDKRFYTIKRVGGTRYKDVPYFLLCHPYRFIYVDDLIKEGVNVIVRGEQSQTITKVNDRYFLCFEREEDVPPCDWRFDMDYYVDLVKNASTIPEYKPGDHIRTNQERTREIMTKLIDQKEEEMYLSAKSLIVGNNSMNIVVALFSADVGRWIDDLSLNKTIVNEMEQDLSERLYKRVAKRIGFPFQLDVESSYARLIIVKEYPKDLLAEIIERGVTPTEHCGQGGGVYRELNRSQ